LVVELANRVSGVKATMVMLPHLTLVDVPELIEVSDLLLDDGESGFLGDIIRIPAVENYFPIIVAALLTMDAPVGAISCHESASHVIALTWGYTPAVFPGYFLNVNHTRPPYFPARRLIRLSGLFVASYESRKPSITSEKVQSRAYFRALIRR